MLMARTLKAIFITWLVPPSITQEADCTGLKDEVSLVQLEKVIKRGTEQSSRKHEYPAAEGPAAPAAIGFPKTWHLDVSADDSSACTNEKVALDFMKNQYLNLLESALIGSLTDEAGSCDMTSPGGCSKVSPYDPSLRLRGIDWPPFGHTMVGHYRLANIRKLIEDAVQKGVPGDFAELGVWRGGAGIYAKTVFNLLGQPTRMVHNFDVFAPIDSYVTELNNFTSFLSVSQSAVEHNFAKYGVLDDNVKFHKGLFKDSVPAFIRDNPDVQLAVLRIDSNFYDSYQDALYYLYPKVPVGGYIIFDDVNAHEKNNPVVQSWNDFKTDNHVPEDLTPIDEVASFFQKTVNVKIDLQKMKPPRDCNK